MHLYKYYYNIQQRSRSKPKHNFTNIKVNFDLLQNVIMMAKSPHCVAPMGIHTTAFQYINKQIQR